MPFISDVDKIDEEFEKYWHDQKVLALHKLCEDEHLDEEQFKSLVETYIFSGQAPVRDDVFKCLDNRPSILQARTIGERIIHKMQEYIDTFITGMMA